MKVAAEHLDGVRVSGVHTTGDNHRLFRESVCNDEEGLPRDCEEVCRDGLEGLQGLSLHIMGSCCCVGCNI